MHQSHSGGSVSWMFHYFLIFLTCLNGVSQLVSLFVPGVTVSFGVVIVGLLLTGVLLYALFTKRRWLILWYRISFWLSLLGMVGNVIAIVVILKQSAELGFFVLLFMPFMIGFFFALLFSVIISGCAIKYYKRRLPYLN